MLGRLLPLSAPASSTKEKPCEDTVRRWLSKTPKESSHQTLALLVSKTVRNKFLLFKAPSLWHFIMEPELNKTEADSHKSI